MVLRLLLVLLIFQSTLAQPLPRPRGPLSLAAAVQFALAHHPSLAVADSEWQAARAGVHEAEAAFAPKLGVGLYTNGGNAPMIVSGGEPSFWLTLPAGGSSLNLSLMVPLYTGGRLQARLARAQAEEKAQLARTALALREVERQARRSYYTAIQARARLETAQWKLAQQEGLPRLTERKVELGSWPATSSCACRPRSPPLDRRSTPLRASNEPAVSS